MASALQNRSDVFPSVRVKAPSEWYDPTRNLVLHRKTGREVKDFYGRYAVEPSQRDLAQIGAFIKRTAQRAGLPVSFSEHDKGLLDEMFAKSYWASSTSELAEQIPGARVKVLLEDTTSGGLEVSPAEFDASVISFPLLNGEVLPHVDLKPANARRIEGASIANVSGSWGTGDGSSMTEMSTDSLISGLDTTCHPLTIAIEFGRDHLKNAAIDIGREVVELCGKEFLTELDRVISYGNGTSEPQGIFQASGVTDPGAPSAGSGGAIAMTDLEAMIFALPKQYRRTDLNCRWLSNDTWYRRARTLAPATGYNTRAFGMNLQNYQLSEFPASIQDANIPNTRAAFCAMKCYRLYRLLGTTVEWTTEGRTLRLANQALLTCRARYGGRVMDPTGFVVGTQYQS